MYHNKEISDERSFIRYILIIRENKMENNDWND